MFDELREVAGMGGPAAELANELLVIRQQYEAGELNAEEYQYLLQQVAEIKAAQSLASDEIACRFIINAAMTLASTI